MLLRKINDKIYCVLEAYNFKCTCSSVFLTQFEWESDNQKYYFRYKNGLGELYNITIDENYDNPIMQFESEYYKEFNEQEFINAMEKQNLIIIIKSRGITKDKEKIPDSEILKMMNGFVDFMNGLNGAHLPKFKNIEDVKNLGNELKRLQENALTKKKRGNNG